MPANVILTLSKHAKSFNQDQRQRLRSQHLCSRHPHGRTPFSKSISHSLPCVARPELTVQVLEQTMSKLAAQFDTELSGDDNTNTLHAYWQKKVYRGITFLDTWRFVQTLRTILLRKCRIREDGAIRKIGTSSGETLDYYMFVFFRLHVWTAFTWMLDREFVENKEIVIRAGDLYSSMRNFVEGRHGSQEEH